MKNIKLLILGLIILSSCKTESNEFTVKPLETSVKGDLNEYISIVDDSFIITKVKDDLASDWEITFKLKKIKQANLDEEDYDIDFRLQLVDENGRPIVGLKDFWMSTGLWGTASELKKLREFIADKNSDEDWFTLPMEVKDNKYKEFLPNDATHFIIRTITKTDIVSKKNDKNESAFNINNIIGNWGGEFGDKYIELIIERIVGDSLFGRNTLDNNTRLVKGLFTVDEEMFTVKARLLEPGDNNYDGEFNIIFNIKDNFAKGDWKSFKGSLNRNFMLENSTAIMNENAYNNNDTVDNTNSTIPTNENIDKMLNDYEKYVNNYIALLKKAQNGDVNTLTQSISVMEDATKFYDKLEKIDEEQFTLKQLNRMNSINLKMTQEAMKLQAKMN